MYERRGQPLPPLSVFYGRLLKALLIGGVIVALSLLLGVLGYRTLEGMSWIDALLNASMILGGMGPVDTLRTNGGKLFASAYAL